MTADKDVISSIKHPMVIATRESLGDAGKGAPTAYILQGARLVSRALEARAPVERVLFLDPVEGADEDALWRSAEETGVECCLVTRGVFFRVLGLGYETSDRVLATVSRSPLHPSRAVELVGSDGCMLIGEGIRDPRNVGVLIRTADAVGAAVAALTEDSADPYCRASVRSSTGSVLSLPVALSDDLPSFLTSLRDKGVRVVGTSAHADVPCWEADLGPPCAVVVGTESTGLSDVAAEACDLLVNIPMHGSADSYNVTVAAGIVLYEVMRQAATGG